MLKSHRALGLSFVTCLVVLGTACNRAPRAGLPKSDSLTNALRPIPSETFDRVLISTLAPGIVAEAEATPQRAESCGDQKSRSIRGRAGSCTESCIATAQPTEIRSGCSQSGVYESKLDGGTYVWNGLTVDTLYSDLKFSGGQPISSTVTFGVRGDVKSVAASGRVACDFKVQASATIAIQSCNCRFETSPYPCGELKHLIAILLRQEPMPSGGIAPAPSASVPPTDEDNGPTRPAPGDDSDNGPARPPTDDTDNGPARPAPSDEEPELPAPSPATGSPAPSPSASPAPAPVPAPGELDQPAPQPSH
jgi:hypothetical protein